MQAQAMKRPRVVLELSIAQARALLELLDGGIGIDHRVVWDVLVLKTRAAIDAASPFTRPDGETK